MKVLVVGGGAAGLMAAGAALRQGHEVTVLEHMEKPAQKILVTGKGRCNVTNDCTAEEFLHHVRTNPRFLFSSLGAFPPAKTMELFESLGVKLKVERGRRVFPVSDKAEEIRQALLRYADGADIVHDGAKKLLLEPLARERWAALSGPDKAKPDHAVAQAAEKAQTKLDEALQLYLTGTLEPAQKAYNERYVCDYPLGLAGVEQYRAQYESLVRIDLERYAARLEQAQKDCKDRFRKDILFRMKDDIFNARRQFRELNKVMEQLTYGEEVYRFELGPSRDPQLAAFYQVIVDKGNQQMTDGDSLDNLAATADPVYERQVDELMEKIMADVDENTRARQEGRRPENVTLSDYVDYRTYLDYDIKVTNTVSGQQASLSRVSRDSSGGENQAPFYVAICASLLQIYQKSENSIRLVLLDEAFSKMTSDRIRPMMELFRRMQLQVLLISTVEKSTAIQPYCDITYSIVRHGDVNAIAPFYRLNASEEIGS